MVAAVPAPVAPSPPINSRAAQAAATPSPAMAPSSQFVTVSCLVWPRMNRMIATKASG